MARVTIEDCIEKVGSHFKVVQIAAHRAHQLELGARPKVEKENDKSVVIALREIAESKIDETVLSQPLADKGPWNQREGLLIQPSDVGQAIADTDSYSDINEVKDDDSESAAAVDNTTTGQGDTVAEPDTEVDEEPKTSET